jgi:hypothetical protein
MSGALSIAARAAVTLALCSACWWIWSSGFSLAAQLRIGELDLVVRILEMFGLLSLVDRAREWFWPHT